MENTIKRISLVFVTIFYFLLGSLNLIIFVIWFLPNSILTKTLIHYGVIPFQGFWNSGPPQFEIFNFKSKCIGCLGSFIEFIPFCLALIILIKIFKNYFRGNIFSLANAKAYQWLGYLFFIDALVAKPIAQILVSYAFSLNTSRPMFSFGIGMNNLESVFCGMIIIVVAKVMYLAHKMQEEEKLII